MSIYFCPSPLYIVSLLFKIGGYDPRGPREGQADLGQPIAVMSPDMVPPVQAGGFGFTKAPAELSRVLRFQRASLDVHCRASCSASMRHDMFLRTHKISMAPKQGKETILIYV